MVHSRALIAAVTDEWIADRDDLLASEACPRCAASDLLDEAGVPASERTHGLVAAIEEILDTAVQDFVRGAEPEAELLDRESRLASVDGYRERMRAQARRIVADALSLRAS